MIDCIKSPKGEEVAADRAKLQFEKTWGKAPWILAVAPGRVNVIGEHVDYNGGWVLPAAINKSMALAASKRDDKMVTLRSEFVEGEVSFSIDCLEKSGKRCWTDYAKGVLAGLRDAGFELCGFDAFLSSDIPVGGGLSSSAALESVFGLAMLKLIERDMDLIALAKLCQKAEHEYAGVPCGLMDQAAVILCKEGNLLLLDCEEETFEQVPFENPDWGLLIVNSGVAHELADGEYGKRRAACHAAAEILGVESLRHISFDELEDTLSNDGLDEEMVRCVRHVVSENDRTRMLVTALEAGDYSRAGVFMNESHASLSEDYRVSCEELDFIAAAAQTLDGVAGCRMTGGGFGGSAIALVRISKLDTIMRQIGDAYKHQYGMAAEMFLTRPSSGAVVCCLDE